MRYKKYISLQIISRATILLLISTISLNAASINGDGVVDTQICTESVPLLPQEQRVAIYDTRTEEINIRSEIATAKLCCMALTVFLIVSFFGAAFCLKK